MFRGTQSLVMYKMLNNVMHGMLKTVINKIFNKIQQSLKYLKKIILVMSEMSILAFKV